MKDLARRQIQKPKLPDGLNLDFPHALSLFSLPPKTKPSSLKNTCLWITILIVPLDTVIMKIMMVMRMCGTCDDVPRMIVCCFF